MKINVYIHRSVYAILDSIIIALFSFVYVITVVRSIPKEEYGVLVLCDSIRVFLILFGDLSIGQALIKYAAEKDDSELPLVNFHSLLLKFILTIFSSSILFFFSEGIATIFHVPRLAILLRWVPLILFAVLCNYFIRQLLIAKQKLKQVFWTDCFVLGNFVFFLTLFKLTGHLSNGIEVIWIVALSYFISSIPGLWFAREYLKFKNQLQIEWLKRITRFASYSFINSAGVQIYSKIDLFMLAYFMVSPMSIAVYNIAHLFTNFATVINDSMNAIVFPESAKIDLSLGEISRERIRKIYETASGFLFLLAIPVTLILFFFPEFILRVFYGEKYQEAASLVRVFAFWGLLHPFYRIAASVFNGIGKPEWNAQLTWFGAVINILVNLALIPKLGVFGAAITSLITSASVLLIYWIILNKQFNIRPLFIDFHYMKNIIFNRK
ncbi:MAG: flippase [bacterium]|nr:flippase [bacterium]